MEIEKKNFFVVSRNLLNSDRWLSQKFTRGQAWIDLFGSAQHTKGYFMIRGIKVNLERGQIGYSQVSLAKRWKWSRNKVKRYLQELENEKDIEVKCFENDNKTIQQNKYLTTIITIVNYDKWQLPNKQNDTADDTAERQQKDSRRYIYNNDNKKKNDNTTMQPAVADPINELIKMFESVNPSYKQLYPIKAQRSALERLLKLMGREKLEGAIKTLPRTNKLNYAPVITTPYDLEKKMGALIAFVQKEQGKTIKNKIVSL